MTLLKDELFSENDVIDPDWVIRYLLNHVPHGKVSGEQVHNIIKKMCKRTKGVRVIFTRNTKVYKCFAIAGLFDDEKKNSIILEIMSSSYKKKFSLEDQFYRQLVHDVADTLCHESIHRYQHVTRDDGSLTGYRSDETHDYYSDPDEMFAYSVNIAHNLHRQFGPNIITTLSDFHNIVKHDYYLADYYSLFYNQPIFKKLMKMVYLNLKAIDRGGICHRPQKCNVP